MVRNTKISIAAGVLALALAAGSVPALAHGMGAARGDRGLFMLAKAGGVTHSQIHQAFSSDTKLKTDFQNMRTARENLTKCLVTGASCSDQINALASAQSAMTQEKMTVWNSLFQSAPNKQQAASVKTKMDQLREEKHALMQQVFKGSPEASPKAD
jgi:hypothetical protein